MSIEKTVKVDQIEVIENGCVQVRTAIVVTEDGKVIGRSFHRHIVSPGDDYSGEESRVKAVCEATHTPEIVEAFIASKGV